MSGIGIHRPGEGPRDLGSHSLPLSGLRYVWISGTEAGVVQSMVSVRVIRSRHNW
jgi:hypothetical protein